MQLIQNGIYGLHGLLIPNIEIRIMEMGPSTPFVMQCDTAIANYVGALNNWNTALSSFNPPLTNLLNSLPLIPVSLGADTVIIDGQAYVENPDWDPSSAFIVNVPDWLANSDLYNNWLVSPSLSLVQAGVELASAAVVASAACFGS